MSAPQTLTFSDLSHPAPAGPSACPQDGCTRGRHLVGSHHFPRRLSREAEVADRHVATALPEGTRRARSAREYVDAVRDAVDALGTMRSDGVATVLAVARQLAWAADWHTTTSRPTWARLMDRTGRSRATIHRALVVLQKAGVLGVVASGRQGTWAGQKGEARAENEAAVYVLAVPGRPRPVDEVETPRVVTSPEGSYAGAREGWDQEAALRARPVAPSARSVSGGSKPGDRAAARPGPAGGPDGSAGADTAGDKMASTQSRRARRRCRLAVSDRGMAARELQRMVPVLRRASMAAVAAVIRPWLAAGWTPGDVRDAIDWTPAGRRRDVVAWEQHAQTIDRWLMYRLEPWVGDDGVPVASPSQRRQAVAVERAAAAKSARLAGRAVDVERVERGADRTARGSELVRAALAAAAVTRRKRGGW